MSKIYYMPGRGGRLSSGLGLELNRRGWDLMGREIGGSGPRDPNNPFTQLSFQQQVDVVQHDLSTHNWTEDALVIGSSFGAYLLAHSLVRLGHFPGRCLFISPILGSVQGRGMLFKPPQAGVLNTAITNRSFCTVAIDILVGSNDEQSPVALCEKLCSACNGRLVIAEHEDHRLEHSTVKKQLDQWLPAISV